MKKLIVLGAAALAMISCTTYSYTSRSVNIANDVNIQSTQTLVDVQVDFTKRINAESSDCKSENEAKNEAKYNAIVDNKIDVVVDPIYKIVYQGHKVRAYLTGFAGYYVNPRTKMEGIKQLDSIEKSTIEKYLLLNQTQEIVPYLYKDSNHITIHHNDAPEKKCCNKVETTSPEIIPEVPATKNRNKR